MTQSSLLQEIDEDLQRQKMEALWKRYGVYVLGGALFIVLATAAFTSWTSWRTQVRQTATGDLMTLVDNDKDKAVDSAKRVAALKNFAESHKGVAQGTLAQLHAAALAFKDGKTDEAVKLYDALAANTDAEPVFRQLADLFSVQAQMEKGDPVVLLTRLNPLLKDSAWRFSATELSAHLALKANDKTKATELFTALTQDAAVPTEMAQRAIDMIRWLNEGK